MLQHISDQINEIEKIESIGVIGDPGCDGLGTYNMLVYMSALQKVEDTDITLVVGDLVPTGEDYFYNRIKDITQRNTENRVYVLPGNHDTGDYEKALGLSEYVLISGDLAIIVLDNKRRKFEDTGLSLLRDTLARPDIKSAIVTFHIPIPNRFSPNAVVQEESDRLFEAMGDNISKVRLMVCGHVHSRFEDVVRGIPMVCSGGGGAVIEDVSEDIKASDINHHIVRVSIDRSGDAPDVSYEIIDLTGLSFFKDGFDGIAMNAVRDAVKNELMASLEYNIYAQRAKSRGLDNMAMTFEALGRSEYQHARNFYSLLTENFSFNDDFKKYVDTENYEHRYLYNMMSEYCDEQGYTLTKLAYDSARTAEKVHEKILREMPEKVPEKIYVCPTCGHLMVGDEAPDRCIVCGCPGRDFEVFE